MVQTLEREATQTEITPEVLPQIPISVSLPQLGGLLGIPIVVRPWWGSVRDLFPRYHRKCGERINMGNWCGHCMMRVRPKEIEIRRDRPHRWRCPGDYTYSHIKWPEVQNGVIVLWEGPCRERWNGRFHKHRQSIEVLDADGQAILVKLSASWNSSHFLIGTDDGSPYVTPVIRKCATVQDAFDWLMPNIVREAMILGLDVKRQGDWYFIPTDKPPKVHGYGSHVPMSAPSLDTNKLYRGAPLVYATQTRHTGGLVVYQTVQKLPHVAPFVRGNVKAPDHPTLHLEGWHIGVRTRSTPGGSRDGPGLD